jgi:uncharacterized protein (DUF302 family)
MDYYISRTIKGKFNETIEKVTALLKEEGFGVLTTIDVRDTMKKKLDVDYKKYAILGACNPHIAIRAFQAEDKIGILLPCNVTVIDQGDGNIEVAIIDVQGVMKQINNPQLQVLALEADKKLKSALSKV